jgi:hypothetical protein
MTSFSAPEGARSLVDGAHKSRPTLSVENPPSDVPAHLEPWWLSDQVAGRG